MSDWNEKQIEFLKSNVVPSARKSYGKFKPILVISIPGSSIKQTEVVGRSEFKHSRGTIFDTKIEAIEYAQNVINKRIEYCLSQIKNK